MWNTGFLCFVIWEVTKITGDIRDVLHSYYARSIRLGWKYIFILVKRLLGRCCRFHFVIGKLDFISDRKSSISVKYSVAQLSSFVVIFISSFVSPQDHIIISCSKTKHMTWFNKTYWHVLLQFRSYYFTYRLEKKSNKEYNWMRVLP